MDTGGAGDRRPTLPPHAPRQADLPLALDGVRVIDFSRVLAGPYVTLGLADMGADVIKIENPRGGDDSRASLPKVGTESTFHLACNRNKRSVTLDFTKPEGRAVALDLIAGADILVESSTTSVMRKYGLDFATLNPIFPRLIYVSVSGYGRTGSMAHAGGVDPVIAAETGVTWMTGPPGERPQFTAITQIDIATGLNAQFAVMTALYARERLGLGQHIDVSLYDSAIANLSFVGAKYLGTGEEPPRLPRMATHRVPTGEFDCADRSLYVVCFTDRHFQRMCREALDRPELTEDPRFATAASRAANIAALADALGGTFKSDTAENWAGKLKAIGVPAGPMRTPSEALTSEFTLEREMVSEIPHLTLGRVFNIESPLRRMSLTPPRDPVHPPLLGQHTTEVLRDILGYGPDRIAALQAADVIGCSNE